jgi:hypothetical protein
MPKPTLKVKKTLLVNSKTCGKAVLHTMFESQRDGGYAFDEKYFQDVGD